MRGCPLLRLLLLALALAFVGWGVALVTGAGARSALDPGDGGAEAGKEAPGEPEAAGFSVNVKATAPILSLEILANGGSVFSFSGNSEEVGGEGRATLPDGAVDLLVRATLAGPEHPRALRFAWTGRDGRSAEAVFWVEAGAADMVEVIEIGGAE